MKYFSVAVIFGLFAISQAMPVEESRGKRFLPNFLEVAIKGAKAFCGLSSVQANNFLVKACKCVDFAADVGGILGGLGDESEIEDMKRFLFNPQAIIENALKLLQAFCANAPPEFAKACKCATGLVSLG